MAKIKYFIVIKIVILFQLTIHQQTSFAQEDTLDVYKLNLYELAKLEVYSVTKSPQAFNDVPATLHIITAEDIKVHGYFTLDEALANLP